MWSYGNSQFMAQFWKKLSGPLVSTYHWKLCGAWYWLGGWRTSLTFSTHKIMSSSTLPQCSLLIKNSLPPLTQNMPTHSSCGMILPYSSPPFTPSGFQNLAAGRNYGLPKISSSLPKINPKSVPTGAWFRRKASKWVTLPSTPPSTQ